MKDVTEIRSWAAEARQGIRIQAATMPQRQSNQAFVDGYEAALDALLARLEEEHDG